MILPDDINVIGESEDEKFVEISEEAFEKI